MPESTGVLLLPDTSLFPNCLIELHIFEERYRQMLRDALQSDWVFSLGSLVKKESNDYKTCVAPVGTLGVLRMAKELPDGRYNIVLAGTHPVQFESWDNFDSDYPKARVTEFIRIPSDPTKEQSVKSLILNSLPSLLEHIEPEEREPILSSFSEIEECSQLIDTVTHYFVSDSKTRLEILSERSDEKRASILILHLTS